MTRLVELTYVDLSLKFCQLCLFLFLLVEILRFQTGFYKKMFIKLFKSRHFEKNHINTTKLRYLFKNIVCIFLFIKIYISVVHLDVTYLITKMRTPYRFSCLFYVGTIKKILDFHISKYLSDIVI